MQKGVYARALFPIVHGHWSNGSKKAQHDSVFSEDAVSLQAIYCHAKSDCVWVTLCHAVITGPGMPDHVVDQ